MEQDRRRGEVVEIWNHILDRRVITVCTYVHMYWNGMLMRRPALGDDVPRGLWVIVCLFDMCHVPQAAAARKAEGHSTRGPIPQM